MISKISINDKANAHIPAYLNPAAVGKNHPKNINTKRVWKLLKKYENPYFQFVFSRFLIKGIFILIFNGRRSFVLKCISAFCPRELATTENTTRQNATIMIGVLTELFWKSISEKK